LLRLWAIPLKREPEAPSIRDDSFYYSVAQGQADLYTFHTLDQAACFAKNKIEALTAIQRSIDTIRADATDSLKIGPPAVPNSERYRKRA
jgi:hypothetical protein